MNANPQDPNPHPIFPLGWPTLGKRPVAQTFLSAGKGDFPVACSTSGSLIALSGAT